MIDTDISKAVASLQKYYIRISEEVQEAFDNVEEDQISRELRQTFQSIERIMQRLSKSDTELGVFAFSEEFCTLLEFMGNLANLIKSDNFCKVVKLSKAVDASEKEGAPSFEILYVFEQNNEDGSTEIPHNIVNTEGNINSKHEAVARLLHSRKILPERILHSLPKPDESEIIWERRHDSDLESDAGKIVSFDFRSLFGN